MFEQYPKIRTELPDRYKAIYEEHYKSNRAGNSKASGAAMRMESWMHRKIAMLNGNRDRILEIEQEH